MNLSNKRTQSNPFYFLSISCVSCYQDIIIWPLDWERLECATSCFALLMSHWNLHRQWNKLRIVMKSANCPFVQLNLLTLAKIGHRVGNTRPRKTLSARHLCVFDWARVHALVYFSFSFFPFQDKNVKSCRWADDLHPHGEQQRARKAVETTA